jgi:hypothetical protein
MRYLICYSFKYYSKKNGYPPERTVVEVNNLEDLQALIEQFDSAVIIHKQGYIPADYNVSEVDCDYLKAIQAPEANEKHHIAAAPDNWKNMQWLEIYNGARE